MALGGAVSDALGHGVHLRPYNFLSKYPSVGLQGKREEMWHHHQIFGFESEGRHGTI
jgi:hypothetical protein